MDSINLRNFKRKVEKNKSRLRLVLSKVEKKPPLHLDQLAEKIDKEVWQEVNCLSCANCCKVMTPTFTVQDIKRISAHLGQTPKEFKDQWLVKDKNQDWTNKINPCQFLDLKTNMCRIYEIRPTDCSGFPHLAKKKMVDYIHVHKQNIEYCPATYAMVEKLEKAVFSIK
jgi:Fe-S-cluster containining protein